MILLYNVIIYQLQTIVLIKYQRIQLYNIQYIKFDWPQIELKHSDLKGWGVFAKKNISIGTAIPIYGESIDKYEFINVLMKVLLNIFMD
jgi:hypothetical protein